MASALPLLAELSGSVGGLTWGHNKGGQYVRQRSVPTNPTSEKQVFARSVLSDLSASWAGLSDAQRTEWGMWAQNHPVPNRQGTSVQLSGQQAYVGCNVRLMQNGIAPNDDCPTENTPNDLLTLTATADASTGEIELTYTATPLAAGSFLQLWQTLPQGPGRDPNRREARLVGYSAAAAASPQTFVSPYPGLAGQFSNLWVCVVAPDGQPSAGLRRRVAWT